MIEIGKNYYYKGNKYVVVGFTKMKSTSDGSWIDAVQYKKATEQISGEIYTRSQTDFEYNFIPAVLEVGMSIIAVSMERVVAKYNVTEVGEENSTAISEIFGSELVVANNVNPNGSLIKVSGGVDYTADYYVLMPDMNMRMSNANIIKEISSLLQNSVDRINRISTSCSTYDLTNARQSVDQTLKLIYAKFNV